MKAIDLFSGCGGFSLGMRWAGITTVEAIDINKSAVDTYNRNLGTNICRNRNISGWLPDLINVDLVYGSPPCQSFSTQGKRDPLDPRGDLVWEFKRVVGMVRPSYFVLENVPGLTQGHGAKVLADLKEGLAALGYLVWNPWLLNAANYGVPQNRRRVFLVGHLEGTPIPLQPLPVPLSERMTAGEALALPMPEGVTGHALTHHDQGVIDRFALTLPGKKEPISRFTRVPYGSPSPTITAASRFIHPLLARTLTPRECARLQSFPDDFVLPSSKVDAYMMVGNAVSPVVAKAIGQSLRTAWLASLT